MRVITTTQAPSRKPTKFSRQLLIPGGVLAAAPVAVVGTWAGVQALRFLAHPDDAAVLASLALFPALAYLITIGAPLLAGIGMLWTGRRAGYAFALPGGTLSVLACLWMVWTDGEGLRSPYALLALCAAAGAAMLWIGWVRTRAAGDTH